jgi:glutathione-regulated potassium-efflux system ancillary protein KefC/glutathione-regulated potassium-efflux system protein KefB
MIGFTSPAKVMVEKEIAMGLSGIQEAVLFLAAAVVTVPFFRKLGMGAVIGYLVAGMIIGPQLLGFVTNVEDILHFAELGVVLLLFVIGLELQPSRLWALRRSVFGLGSAQVFGTGAIFAGIGFAFGLPATAALMIGLSLSLSSTALALQTLAEKKQLTTHHGRAAFAILLFQDLAAIPLLGVFALLGYGSAHGVDWLGMAKAVAVVAAVIVGGRWLLRPYLRFAASSTSREVFIAATLLVVVGTALIMQQSGMSMALGSFLAGVLLADSEYRHELEADIEPFKGLLLGLFFIAVGMSTDLGQVIRQPLTIIGLTLGLMTIKALVLYGLARLTKHNHGSSVNLAIYVSQGGEFAFVLFGVAVGAQALDKTLSDTMIVVVSLSMVVMPLLVVINDKWLLIGHATAAPKDFDNIEPQDHRVIIAGFGRFGQVIARTLRMKKITFTALEANFEQVDFVRRFGNKIYFGDASRLDLLQAARADLAEVFVLAIDDIEASVKTAEIVKKHYPHLKIYARARNRVHAYRLMDVGVDKLIRETLLSSMELARDVLIALGDSPAQAEDAIRKFRRHDDELLATQHKLHKDEAQLIAATRQGAVELERLFEEDTDVAK